MGYTTTYYLPLQTELDYRNKSPWLDKILVKSILQYISWGYWESKKSMKSKKNVWSSLPLQIIFIHGTFNVSRPIFIGSVKAVTLGSIADPQDGGRNWTIIYCPWSHKIELLSSDLITRQTALRPTHEAYGKISTLSHGHWYGNDQLYPLHLVIG